MEKAWYKSLTLWGAIGFATVGILEDMSTTYPNLLVIAKALKTVLTMYGLRRASNK